VPEAERRRAAQARDARVVGQLHSARVRAGGECGRQRGRVPEAEPQAVLCRRQPASDECVRGGERAPLRARHAGKGGRARPHAHRLPGQGVHLLGRVAYQ